MTMTESVSGSCSIGRNRMLKFVLVLLLVLPGCSWGLVLLDPQKTVDRDKK